MRLVVGLLAFAGAVNLALADDPPAAPAAPSASAPAAAAPASTPAATAAPAAAASPANAAQSAAPAKPAVDPDVQHFTQEGFKPEMRHGQEVYCRKETALGSRLTPLKTCGTIQDLKVMEQQTRSDMQQSQQRQASGPTIH